MENEFIETFFTWEKIKLFKPDWQKQQCVDFLKSNSAEIVAGMMHGGLDAVRFILDV